MSMALELDTSSSMRFDLEMRKDSALHSIVHRILGNLEAQKMLCCFSQPETSPKYFQTKIAAPIARAHLDRACECHGKLKGTRRRPRIWDQVQLDPLGLIRTAAVEGLSCMQFRPQWTRVPPTGDLKDIPERHDPNRIVESIAL